MSQANFRYCWYFFLYNLQQLSFSNRGFCCWYTVQINFRASAYGTRQSSTTGAEVSAVGTCYIYTSTTTGAVYLILGHATIKLQIVTGYLALGVAHFRYRSSAACIEYATHTIAILQCWTFSVRTLKRIGLSINCGAFYTLLIWARARICERLRSPGIDYKESIPPAYVARQAGTKNLQIYHWNRFLGS